MAEWIELEKKRYLTAHDMGIINNNFSYLKDYLSSFNTPISNILDVAVAPDISPLDIQEKFNAVEQNIQTFEKVFNERLKVKNRYFKKYTWGKYLFDVKKEVYRWIDWLNEARKYKITYQSLTDINGEQITDINGNPLEVFKIIKEEF